MSDARERAQEWFSENFDKPWSASGYTLIKDLLAALTTAERERDEAIAERDRCEMALERIAKRAEPPDVSPHNQGVKLDSIYDIAREALGGGE